MNLAVMCKLFIQIKSIKPLKISLQIGALAKTGDGSEMYNLEKDVLPLREFGFEPHATLDSSESFGFIYLLSAFQNFIRQPFVSSKRFTIYLHNHHVSTKRNFVRCFHPNTSITFIVHHNFYTTPSSIHK